MLAPDHRSTLLELLEPPVGYELDAAVGLTYTLDLDALLTLPTAFALRGSATLDATEPGDLTPLGVLDALRSYADRITVCCDASGIALPSGARMGVFAFLEKTVLPMRAPRGGVFHPKAWVVRFRNDDDLMRHRVLLSSRNLTFDRSWDTVVRLDEEDVGSTLPGVARLVEACADGAMVVSDLPVHHRERLDSLAQTLASARFAPPPGFTSVRVLPLGTSTATRTQWPFPKAAVRGLVMSPFLTRSFLARFPTAWAQTCVVSRTDELDRELRDLASQTDPLAMASSNDVPSSGFYNVNPSAVDESGAGPGTLSGLHAKLFVLDLAGGESLVYTGSANATAAAFESNVEVLVEMAGRTRDVGVRSFLGQDGLRPLLLTHAWGDDDGDGDLDPIRDHLNTIRRALGELAIDTEVSAAGDGRYSLRYRSRGNLPALGDAGLEVRPLTVAAWSRVDLPGPLDHVLSVDEAGISGFLAVRVTEGPQQATMLLSTNLTGVPAGRDERIIAALLADPARLIRYLMMLLLDRPEDRFDGAAQDAIEQSRHATHATLQTIPLLEVMARALLGSRTKLAEVDRLLRELESGSDLVDEDLHELWASIRVAAGLEGDRA